MKLLINNILLILFIILSLLFISCDKEVSVTEPPRSPHKGFIFVDSNPQGARIYLNGWNTGQFTPDSVKWLADGNYKIMIRLALYRDTTFNIEIEEDIKKHILIDNTKNPAMRGSIIIESYPKGAAILFNDSVINQSTPYTITNLVPGEYKINLIKETHLEDSADVVVESQKVTKVFRTLKDTSIWVVYNQSNSGLPTNFINYVAVDKINNDKWIGTHFYGVVVYNEKEWKIYNTSNSPLPDDLINYIYIDEQNVKWIGTGMGGLARFDGATWTIYNTSNSEIPGNYINSIKKSPDNNIWVTTYGNGFGKFDGFKWTNYNINNNPYMPNDEINDIEFDDRNNIFLATWTKGVIAYDGKSWDEYAFTTKDTVHNVSTTCLVFKEGMLYASFYGSGDDTWFGIKRRIGDNWQMPGARLSPSTTSFTFDKNNFIYVCSNEGFGVLPNFLFTHHVLEFNSHNSPLPNDQVKSIAIDKNNIKWVATYGGLVKYKAQY
ncbi:MAG: PEGA domain-containing protein [Ignavibacteriales bacterium]|nr:PEGA domain-containing protein [Ignavibacteriales bacterium]